MGYRDFWQVNRVEEGWDKIPLTESQKLADEKQMELLGKKETFAPRKIEGLTKAEQLAVNAVTKMMEKGIPGVSEAMDAVRGWMTADLSPKNIPGLAGLFKQAGDLGGRLMGKTKRGLALTGNLPSQSSPGSKKLGRTWEDIQDSYIQAAYPFYQQAMANKYSAPERLANLGIGDISTRTGMATTVGAMPRTIQQQIQDAIFEAKRKTQGFPYEFTAPLSQNIMAQTRYGWDPGYMVGSEADVMRQTGQTIGQMVAMAYGGGAGMAAMQNFGGDVQGAPQGTGTQPATQQPYKPQYLPLYGAKTQFAG